MPTRRIWFYDVAVGAVSLLVLQALQCPLTQRLIVFVRTLSQPV